MKILDIIKQHYCDEFYLKYIQDEEFTFIDVSEGEYSERKTFVFPNEMVTELLSFLIQPNTAHVEYRFQKAKFKFVDNRWVVNAEHAVVFKNNVIFV